MSIEKKLDEEDTRQLQSLVAELNALQTKYGQHCLALDELRKFHEYQILQSTLEGNNIRDTISNKRLELQTRSQILMQKYGISLVGENWVLDTVNGVFLPQKYEI